MQALEKCYFLTFRMLLDPSKGDPGRGLGSEVASGEGRWWPAAALGTSWSSQCGTAGTAAGKEALRMRFRREGSLPDLEEKVGWLKWKGHEAWEKRTKMGRTTLKGQMKCWVGEKEKMQLPKSSSRVENSGKSIGHDRFLR